MIVIVEGIDRVGKTTLINKIVKELGFIKYEGIEKYDKINSKNFYLTQRIETEKLFAATSVLKAIDKMKGNIIIDRFHVSEYVYGLCERGYFNSECFEVDDILGSLNTTLILVRPKDIKQSIKEHGKDLYRHSLLFENFCQETSIKHKIICNYDNLDYAFNKVKEEM